MPQTLVLSVGSDPVLLDTRDLLLRSAGYIVVSATSIKEAVSLFQDGDFDLLILCQTIPQKDCERLTSFIRASGSRIPIASVSATIGEYSPFTDAPLEKEPAAFLAGIQDLLAKRAQVHPIRFSTPQNDGETAPTKDAPTSYTGFERQNRATNDRHGTSNSLEHARPHTHSR